MPFPEFANDDDLINASAATGERLSRHVAEARPSLDGSGGGSHPQAMGEERLAKLEGAYDALKVVRPMTVTVISVFLAALVFVLGVLATQQYELARKVDGIPQVLREEFRAMRAEMAAQTSAIANSITATRQMQPQPMVVIPPSQTPPDQPKQ